MVYVKVNKIYPCFNQDGLVENVVILVHIVVNEDKYREILGSSQEHEEGQDQLGQLLPMAVTLWFGWGETFVVYMYLGMVKSVNEDTSICWLTSFTPGSVYQFVEHS